MFELFNGPRRAAARCPELRRHVTEQDFVIHDAHLDGVDARNAGYNLGDLLNMPYLKGLWARAPHANARHLERMHRIASRSPSSVLAIYCDGRPEDEPIPSMPRLKAAVREYLETGPHTPGAALRGLLRDPRCLCVHMRTGDVEVDGAFKSVVARLARKFATVVLLVGAHLDQHYRTHAQKRQVLARETNAVLDACANARVYLDHPDAHLCAMMLASNLLVHRGGFSALGVLVSEGRVYATDAFEYDGHENWRAEVQRQITRVPP